MPIKIKYPSNKDRLSNTFVNREVEIKHFFQVLDNKERDSYKVLSFYGPAGIGKSSLIKYLQQLIMERNDICYATIDLSLPHVNEVSNFLVSLHNQLHEKYLIDFPAFEIAYALYIKKINPKINFNDNKTFKNFKFVSELTELLTNLPVIGLMPRFIKILGEKYISSWKNYGEEAFLHLLDMDPAMIEKYLPALWAKDLKSEMGNDNQKFIVFIDNYVELLGTSRNDEYAYEWLRELVINLPEILWVIAGREALRWVDFDADWSPFIDNFYLTGFSRDVSLKLLKDMGIQEPHLLENLLNDCEGNPFCLSLVADTYFTIKNKFNREPKPEDFNISSTAILNRLLNNLDHSSLETLKVLALPRFINYEIFTTLVEAFKTDFPLMSYSNLLNLSIFSTKDNGESFEMHKLAKAALIKMLDQELQERIHRTLFEYHNKKLFLNQNQISFQEAYYHGRSFLSIKDLLSWFYMPITNKSIKITNDYFEDIFDLVKHKYGQNNSVICSDPNEVLSIYGEFLKLLCKGVIYQNTDTYLLRTAAFILINIGKSNEALYFFHDILHEFERNLSFEKIEVIEIYEILALLYFESSNYETSQIYLQLTLEKIKERDYNYELSKLSEMLMNMAVLYERMALYDKATAILEISLEFSTETDSYYSDAMIKSLVNLGSIYLNQQKLDEAKYVFSKVIKMYEKNNPDGKDSLIVYAERGLGNIYSSIGNVEEALSHFNNAYEISKLFYGLDNPIVLEILSEIANTYLIIGDNEKALSLYNKVLQNLKETLGCNHPSYVKSMLNLAMIYNKLGKKDTSKELCNKAILIVNTISGPNHPFYNEVQKLKRELGVD